MKTVKPLLLMLLGAMFFFSCNKNDEPEIEREPTITFENEFDTPQSWLEFNDEYGFGTVENGEFIFESKKEGLEYWYSMYFFEDPSYNYSIESAFRVIESSDSFLYGLTFIRKDNYNHYYMYLHENCFISGYLYNYVDHPFCELTSAESILLDGEYNILKVEKKELLLTYFINGDKVYEYDITVNSGNRFGFKLGSKGKVAIDYIRVTNLLL